MNEKQEKFQSDIKNLRGQNDFNPPPDMFIGEMQCFLCRAETIGLPVVSSGWRCIEAEGKRYFLCKKCLPSTVASEATWRNFYVRAVRKIWEKDFNRAINELTIYIDAPSPAKRAPLNTPSGTQQIKRVADVVSGSVEDLLRDIYENCLPTILAAFEQIPASEGKTEFTATGDCNVRELDYTIALSINFQSFGGVRIEDLPEPEAAKAKQFLPPFLTMEALLNGTIQLSFNEMERQNAANMRQAFAAAMDNLTFIEGYLYKITFEFKFEFPEQKAAEEGEKVFAAPPNPNLN